MCAANGEVNMELGRENEVSKFLYVTRFEQTGAAKTSESKPQQLAEPPCT